MTTFLMTGFGMVLGALLGVGLYARWLDKKSATALRLPHKWPLVSRVLVNNEEYEVLKWLRATFHDHFVMVKLPVLRFTAPVESGKKASGRRWQTLLNGVYCTFTVCTANGNVVGCVDVPGKRGLAKASRSLKEALLSDCHIAYTVVRSSQFPKASSMRAAFLGELEVQDQQEHQPTRGGDSSFHADLDSFTRQKKQAAKEAALRELNQGEDLKSLSKTPAAGFNTDASGSAAPTGGRFPPHWEDSFIQPDESRPAKLG